MPDVLRRVLASSAALLLVAGCGPAEPPAAETAAASEAEQAEPAGQSTADLAAGLVEALGGREALESIETLVLAGGGSRTRVGQISETGGEDVTGELSGVTETIDFANGRAAFDYDIAIGPFMQHRTEVLTTYMGEPVGWNTGPGRPSIATSPDGIFSWATQNTPEMLLRRNIVTIALAAAETASEAQAAEEREFGGETSLYGTATLPSTGEEIELYFDPETGLLDAFVALDTETMLGDVEAEYVFGDYEPVEGPVDGLVLPRSLTIRKQDRPYSSIDYSSIAVNDPAALEIFAVPDEAAEQAEQVVATDGSWAPLELNEVAEGVWHAVGYSHHSMVVEFPSFVAVVEGPYTDAQSLTLARRVDEEIGKPIRYVAPSHPHYDHTGGVRGLASVGADVVVAAGHEAELSAIVEAPHTNPPDALARARMAGEDVGAIEVFSGERTIEEGDRRLVLYEVEGIPHVEPKVLAYVPDAGALFQSDLFFGAPSPDATALYEAIEERGLAVETIVGGHGGTIPFASLVEAASAESE